MIRGVRGPGQQLVCSLVPSSPEVKATSNRNRILAVNVRTSISARRLPVRPNGLMENGARASLRLIISGLLYLRSVTDLAGSEEENSYLARSARVTIVEAVDPLAHSHMRLESFYSSRLSDCHYIQWDNMSGPRWHQWMQFQRLVDGTT